MLFYRLISHWACIPAGGLAWLVLRATAGAGTAAPVGTVAVPSATSSPSGHSVRQADPA